MTAEDCENLLMNPKAKALLEKYEDEIHNQEITIDDLPEILQQSKAQLQKFAILGVALYQQMPLHLKFAAGFSIFGLILLILF